MLFFRKKKPAPPSETPAQPQSFQSEAKRTKETPSGLSAGEKEKPPHEDRSAEDLADQALDTLAECLRAYGAHAFDLEAQNRDEIRALFDTWAQHILVGANEPGQIRVEIEGETEDRAATSSKTSSGDTAGPLKRNWPRLRRDFAEQRRQETNFVDRSRSDLRQALWAFIQCLSRSVIANAGEETQMFQQLKRVQDAVAHDTTSDIKHEALAMVELVRHASHDRKHRQTAELTALNEQLENLGRDLDAQQADAELDALTGVYTRTTFDDHAARITDFGIVFGRSAGLFLLDVDDLQWINDSFSNAAGDAVLTALGKRLRRNALRRGDFVARFEDDSFAVILRDLSRAEAEELAEGYLDTARDLVVEYQGQNIRFTLSIGLALLYPGENIASWSERAKLALDTVKQSGKDRYLIHQPGAG